MISEMGIVEGLDDCSLGLSCTVKAVVDSWACEVCRVVGGAWVYRVKAVDRQRGQYRNLVRCGFCEVLGHGIHTSSRDNL